MDDRNKMKIVYLHQYFRTPAEGGAIRSYYLAKALVEKGNTVEVVTSYNGTKEKTELIEGIKVHYIPNYYDNTQGFAGRISSFLKFVYQSYKKCASITNIDLVYATSTPLTIGMVALRLKKKYKIPYYFEVRDLWPEAPIQMGVIRSSFLKSFLYKLEKKIYSNAQKIIALSPGIRDGIENSLSSDNSSTVSKPIYILPNISDCDYFHPEVKSPSLEDQFGVKGKFVVSYFGAIGKVNHLEFIMDVIKECKAKNLHSIHFLIAGKGSEADRFEKQILNEKLDNATFVGYQNREGIKELLNVTDAAYISFADKPVLETNSPNKFFDAIAAGKLCIVNSHGWIEGMIEEKKCGFYADPYNAGDFIMKISKFVNDRSRLMLYQNNARKLAENHFSRSLQTERFSKLFTKESKMDSNSASAYTWIA